MDELSETKQAFVNALLKQVDGLGRVRAAQMIARECSDVWNALDSRVRFFPPKGKEEPI